MKMLLQFIALMVAIMVVGVSFAPLAQAEAVFSNMSSAGFRIVNGGMSSLGGAIASTGTPPDSTLSATSMNPYQQELTVKDFEKYYVAAVVDLDEAQVFRDGLNLIDAKEPGETGIGRLLMHPKENYETVPGLLAGLAAAEDQLISSRDVFAYGAYIGYAGAIDKLNGALKTLASIYLHIADEFLIDALEFRFSDMTIGAEKKLDEQICLLGYGASSPTECIAPNATPHGAQYYYEKALNSFLYGFYPSSIGRSIHISDYFDPGVYSLFNLAVERYSIATREKSAKLLARQISPDPILEASAKKAGGDVLKRVATGTYLLSATVAQRQADKFVTNGGGRLTNALNALRNQGFIFRDNVNPLGYDNRFVPMQDFAKLYGDATNRYTAAKLSQDSLLLANREFDSDVNRLQTAIMNLAENPGGYRAQLATLTGIAVNDPDFDGKVSLAGDDLYKCDIDSDHFDTCLATKTKGILGSKYNQVRVAQIQVDQAVLKKQNILAGIDLENKRHNETLIIQNKYNTSYRNTLSDYLKNMKEARKIERTKTTKKGEPTEWQTITTFSINDPALKYNITQSKDLQQAQYEMQIATTTLTDEITVMNMVNNAAEAEIEIGLAIEMKNSAILDFENTIKERDNLLFLYAKAKEQILYNIDEVKEKFPEVRILRTQAALDYVSSLNAAAHYTYLAAKSLEYKYLKPLNVTMPGGHVLNIADVYKIQTAEDVKRILDNLSAFDSCSWGSVNKAPVQISLAYDILGLTSKYLNPTGVLTSSAVVALRKQKVQEFISPKINSTNSFSFNFSTSLNDYYIAKLKKYNMKIWWGQASPPCDPVQAGGIAVNISTSQASGDVGPYVTLIQSGHSTYYDNNKNILEYIPVSEYLNMQSTGNDTSVSTSASFHPSINSPPVAGQLWDPSFKGRSLASSNWQMVVEDTGREPFDWTKVSDIVLYIDTIASNLP